MGSEVIKSVTIDGKGYYVAAVHPNWLKLLKEPFHMLNDNLREALNEHIRSHGVVLLLDAISDTCREMGTSEDEYALNRFWRTASIIIEAMADMINHLEDESE